MMKRLALVALVLLSVIPYAGAIHAPLLYDDRSMLDNRWLVKEAGPLSVFRQDYWHGVPHAPSDLYRPLTVLSLAWNLRLSPSREGIRGVNIAAHVLATLALYGMLAAIARREAAWIGASLFAVHPLGSEAVLLAVGRAEILAAVFGLLAFTLFVKLSDDGGVGGFRLGVSAASFFLALCFKESAAGWLGIGAAWMALRPKQAGPSAWVVAARAGAYLAAFASFFALRVAVVGWGHDPAPFVDNPLAAVSGATRWANAVSLMARYGAKMLWPRTLSSDYGFDQIPVLSLFPWGAAVAAAIAACVVGALLTLRRKNAYAASFLVAFVPLAFAVTGNLLFPIGTIFGERLAYTPLMGFCGLAGLVAASIQNARSRRILACVLIAACAVRTIARSADYRDLATFNEATVAASPRAAKALVNAGRTRLRLGNAAGARPLFERAVAVWPEYERAWRLLAEASDLLGDSARADEARRREKAAGSQGPPGDEPL